MTSFLNEIVDSNSGLFISGQPSTGSGKKTGQIEGRNRGKDEDAEIPG